MIRLIQLEWLKIYNYKLARIFILLYCLFLFGLIMLGTQKFSLAGKEIDLVKEGIFNFPQIWNFTTYFTALIKVFLAFIIITTVVNEFQNGTFKQNVIDGLSRKEFLLSKIYTIVILSLVSTILVFIFSFIFGLKYNTITNPDYRFDEIGFLVGYFVKLVAFMMLALFLSIIIRKSAFTFILLFLWWFAEKIVNGIEKWATMNMFEQSPQAVINKVVISDYLPLTSMSNIIPIPVARLSTIQALMGQGKDIAAEIPWNHIGMCCIYAVLFGFLSYRVLKKKDW